jgi:DNA repair exonuclease SbcCD ATPase subunit
MKKVIVQKKTKIKIDNEIKNISIVNTEIKKLDNSLKKINYIIHLADIHIKNDQTNKNEYLCVFNNLYDKIKKLNNLDETLIVICGDIFDNKTTLKSDAISILCDFFSNLCDITDCIIILGNHDQNINNENSTDAITPILNANFITKYKNHVLKKSGIYEYANILFGVTDIFSTDTTKMNFETDKMKINLYHGIVNGASVDNDNINNLSGKFSQKDFSDGNLTLLGDIHKYQYLNKKKTFAYPSSLLQLNYGENIQNHGFIYWDISNKNDIKSEFVKINNDYGYITVKIEKNKIIDEPDFENLPPNLRLRILYRDTLSSKRQEIINRYKSKYNILQIDEIQKIVGIDLNFSDNEKIKKIKTIDNITTVNNIIMDFIKENNVYKEDILKKTQKKLENITKTIDYNFNDNTKNIKLIKMTFNNMFIYGENNMVNFNNLKKIIGLLSNNKTGKTSLIDIIFFSIWGESDRTLFNTDVIKNGKKKMDSTIILSVNDIIYKIVRESNTTMKRMVNYVNLYELKDNDYIKLNDDDKKKTEDKIRKIFGEMEDFTFLNCLTQDKPINFLTMIDIERKALINKLFDLNIIKVINKKVSFEYRDINRDLIIEEEKIKNFDELIIKSKISEIIKEKELNDKKYIENEKKLKEINQNIGKCEHELLVYNKENIKQLSIQNLEECKLVNLESFENVSEKINNQNNIIKLENKKLNELDEKISQCKDIASKHNIWESDKKKKLKKIDNEYQNLNKEKRPIRKIAELDEKNNAGNINKIKEYQKEIKKIKKNKKKINQIEDFNIDEYNKYIKLVDELDNENKKLICKIQKDKNSLNKLHNHTYNLNCKDCMYNDITKQKIYLINEIKQNEEILLEIENKSNENNKNINKHKHNYNKYINNKKIMENNNEIDNNIKKLQDDINLMIQFCDNINKIKKENNIDIKHNDLLDSKINNNRSTYSIIQNTCDKDYDDYINTQINISLLNKNIIKFKTEYDNLIKEREKIQVLINEINKDIHIYKQNEKSILKINELTNELAKLNKEYNIYYDEKDKNIKMINKYNDEIMVANFEIKNGQDSINKIKDLQDSKNILEIIKNITDNGGIIEEIVRTSILPAIENLVNNILADIESFKIKINYDTNNIKITKIENNNMAESSCLTASGHEKAILNIIFRIALTKLNNKIKTNFFIIDEAFKNCDETRKQKLNTLFEYIRSNYTWCLVVTHDDFIKSNFDSEINIENDNGTSIINCI